MTWQLIDTAPKDGTKIIAFSPELFGVCIAQWGGLYKKGWYVDASSQDGMGFDDVKMTHWMPLPNNPNHSE